ncbi:MAG: response regulator, partial [Saprospiraceae bacterium]
MDKIKILWADDEIDLLKPQMLFLEKKGYEVVTVSNGHDAVEECETEKNFDVVFLDESMPGLTGLETLARIKENNPRLPVVMITKNEAEHVMEEAIGSQISDYLIKPVNPNQILLTLKKIIDNKRLVREKTTSGYQQEFRMLSMQINSGPGFEEWGEIYRKLINWEIKIDQSQSVAMGDILSTQKSDANAEFSRFVAKNYEGWVNDTIEAPVMSHNLMRRRVFPELKEDVPTVMLLLDNLRFDQWKVIEPLLSELFRVENEEVFYSILPTATQYSRNAIFAGMMPADIERVYPKLWKNDAD